VDVSPGEGGDVTVNGDVACSYPETFYVREDSYDVLIEATPAPGYCFIGWSGEDTLPEDENPLELPKARNLDLTAVFAPECVEYGSRDGTIQLSIPYGTYALDENEAPVTKIGFTILDDPPLSADAEILGHAYRLEPAGATFSPAINMTWSYDPADIPEDISPEDLTIAYYDESRGNWVALDSEIDTVADTVSAPIDHLSIYAVLAPTEVPPPEFAFSLSQLNIRTRGTVPATPVTSITVKPDAPVYIDVFVQNTTDTAGSCTVTLEINGTAEKHQKVTLGAGGFARVTFETARSEAGTYTVAVDGLEDEASFTVIGETPEPQAAAVSPAEPATAIPATIPTTPGARAKVLAPLIAAIFLAIFIPIRVKIRKNRDWY